MTQPKVFYYGEDGLTSIRFDHVTQTYPHVVSTEDPSLILTVVTVDGMQANLHGEDIQRFMAQYEMWLASDNSPQPFMEQRITK